MVTYNEVLERVIEDKDYPALLKVESLCEEDLDASIRASIKALKEYSAAFDSLKSGTISEYEFDLIHMEYQKAALEDQEKTILYKLFRELYDFKI